MNNYDSMTVDELMSEYAEWARNRAGTHWEIHGIQGVVVDDENPLNAVARKHAIIAALRRKVIEEASVGVGTVWREGKAPLEGAPEMDVSCETKDGDYDLVPHKETPVMVTPEELAYMKREIGLHENYELNVGKIPEIK